MYRDDLQSAERPLPQILLLPYTREIDAHQRALGDIVLLESGANNSG